MVPSRSTPRAAGIFLVDPTHRGGPAALLLKRAGWVPKPGTWGTPGGLLERGETPWCGACRELAEETGLKLGGGRGGRGRGSGRGDREIPSVGRPTAAPSHVTHAGYRTFVVMAPSASRQRVRLCSENTAAVWVPIAGLLRGRRPLHPGLSAVLPRLVRMAEGIRPVPSGRRAAHHSPSIPASLRRLGFTAASVAHYLDALERTPSGRDAGPRGAPVGAPPVAVQRAALEGLTIRARFPPSRRGGTDIGVGRAIQLVLGGPLPERSVRRMAAYFSRHARDRSPGWDAPGAESKGYQAWLLWGGDAGRVWAERVVRGWKG